MLASLCLLTLAVQGFEGTYTTRRVTLRAEAVPEGVFDLSVDRLMQLGASVDSTVMWIKGPRFRGQAMDMGGGAAAYMIFNTATQRMTMVIPTQRSYYEVSLAGAAEGAKDAEEEPEPTVQPLGRTQTIGGLKCTGYRVTQDGNVSLVWTTTDRNFRLVFEAQMRAWQLGEGGGAAKALTWFRKYGFPVMTQALDEGEGYSVEVITLTAASQPDSLFVVPAGFKKTTPGR
jgi:uncharacterized protein DUF4412